MPRARDDVGVRALVHRAVERQPARRRGRRGRARGGEGVASYLGEAAADIAIVGTARETNIEAVIAQRPDLILASSRLPEAQYQLLSQIAPTVVPRTEGFEPEAWKAEARLFGEALGREEWREGRAQRVAGEKE